MYATVRAMWVSPEFKVDSCAEPLRVSSLLGSRARIAMFTWLWAFICLSCRLIILNILKYKAIFKIKLEPITAEAMGEKNSSFFTLKALQITLNKNHTAQTAATVVISRDFVM